MIINSPTGLFSSVLPKTESDSASVLYTISNQSPPEERGVFVILPEAESLKGAPPKIHTDEERRAAVGELVYTISKSNRDIPGSNRKLFEIGQFLEFVDNTAPTLSTDNTPSEVLIQHNTNVLDLEDLGLTEEEIAALTSDSEVKKKELELQLSNLKSEIAGLKSEIGESQKRINEYNKAINAIKVIGNAEITEKLETSRDAEIVSQGQLVELHNNKISESEDIYNQLLDISQLVR